MSDPLHQVADGRAARLKVGGWLDGRSRRMEYWLCIVPILALMTVLSVAGQATLAIAASILIVPVWIRRLHDFGRSGWWTVVINISLNLASFVAGQTQSSDCCGRLYWNCLSWSHSRDGHLPRSGENQ